jgi:hypothetical protein
MAKEIYVKQKFGTGATLQSVQLESEASLPSGVSGEVCYSGNRFYMHNGAEWDEVVTNESFGNATHQIFDNKSFDGGGFATG